VTLQDSNVIDKHFTALPDLPPDFVVRPIWPLGKDIPTTIMRGGQALRHFRLTDHYNTPASAAIVHYGTSQTAVTDAGGYFTVTLRADDYGLGSHFIEITKIQQDGILYPPQGETIFTVIPSHRHFAHSWQVGRGGSMSLGLMFGSIDFDGSGATKITLEETNASMTADDQLVVENSARGEVGVGVGYSLHATFLGDPQKGAAIKVEGPGVNIAFYYVEEGGVVKVLNDPYRIDQSELLGLLILAGILDTEGALSEGDHNQDIAMMNNLAFLSGWFYDYIAQATGQTIRYDERYAAYGARYKGNVSAGATFDVSFLKDNANSELLQLQIAESDVDFLALTRLSQAPNGNATYVHSVALDSELDIFAAALPIFLEAKFFEGGHVESVQETVRYLSDQNSKQIELKLESTLHDPPIATDQLSGCLGNIEKRLTSQVVTFTIDDAYITPAILETARNLASILDESQAKVWKLYASPEIFAQETAAILSNADQIDYERNFIEILECDYSLGLSLDAGAFKIGFEPMRINLVSTREFVTERDVYINGIELPTEKYSDDHYVQTAGQSFSSLANIGIGAALNKTGIQVAEGVLFDGVTSSLVVTLDDGPRSYVARLVGPPKAATRPATHESVSMPSLRIMGWLPELASLPLPDSMQRLAGANFAIGGIYAISPYTASIPPGTMLQISYTLPLPNEVDESVLNIYRLDPVANIWLPLPTMVDPQHHLVSTEIGELGTFALGADTKAPTISLLSPAVNSPEFLLPILVYAIITDTGVGIDSDHITLTVNGKTVPAVFSTATNVLSHTLTSINGMELITISVSAIDTSGNSSIVTRTLDTLDPSPVDTPMPTITNTPASPAATPTPLSVTITPTATVSVTPTPIVTNTPTAPMATPTPPSVAQPQYLIYLPLVQH